MGNFRLVCVPDHLSNMLLATLSNNISAWNQCCTLNSSFHCSFRGLSGPQFQFGFYLWNLIWIILVSPSWHGGDPLWGCAQFWPLQLPKVQSSFMIIISPLLCGHNSPTFTQFWHSSHLMMFPAEVRATRWCREAGSSTPSQTTREKPLFNLEVTKLINLEVTKMGD